jgi:hypothetical protein
MTKKQPEAVKIGAAPLANLNRSARLYGGSAAEMARRAIEMYLDIRRAAVFYRAVEMLNGRKLSTVLVELLALWVEGEVKLKGD